MNTQPQTSAGHLVQRRPVTRSHVAVLLFVITLATLVGCARANVCGRLEAVRGLHVADPGLGVVQGPRRTLTSATRALPRGQGTRVPVGSELCGQRPHGSGLRNAEAREVYVATRGGQK